MHGAPGLPDMVFRATSRSSLMGARSLRASAIPEAGRRALFRQRVRPAERPRTSPKSSSCRRHSQEGAGDCIWDATRQMFWAGSGRRSDADCWPRRGFLRPADQSPRTGLGRFYHLDTCFCPLSGGEVLYYPPAFTPRRSPDPRSGAAPPADRGQRRRGGRLLRQRRQHRPRDRHGRADGSLPTAERARLLGSAGGPAPFILSGGRRFCMTLRLDLKPHPPPSPDSSMALDTPPRSLPAPGPAGLLAAELRRKELQAAGRGADPRRGRLCLGRRRPALPRLPVGLFGGQPGPLPSEDPGGHDRAGRAPDADLARLPQRPAGAVLRGALRAHAARTRCCR